MLSTNSDFLSKYISDEELRLLFDRAMTEDGARKDITTLLTVPETAHGVGIIRAKENLVLAGLLPACRFFQFFDPDVIIEVLATDGDRLKAGDAAARIEGSQHTLLAVERSALNLLQHLSGIASLTARFVQTVEGTKTKVLDTRKTVPGLRNLAKYAVFCGGGTNHRVGLHDAVLIKDNHVAAAGGVGKAVLLAHSKGKADLFVEVEVRTVQELEEAIDGGANRALLDNMTIQQMEQCVERAGGRIELEASGNVTLESIREIAQTGVNFISSGALTHSAPAADLNMKIEPL